MNWMPLSQAVSCVREEGAEAFARSFFNDHRIKKIIGGVILKSGLPFDFRDDLIQETYSILYGYASAGRITDPDGVYSLVYAAAFNSARTIRHHEGKNGANIPAPGGDDEDGDRRLNDIIDERTSFDQGEAVDILAARNKIASILKAQKYDPMQTHPLISSAEPVVHMVRSPDTASRAAAAKELSPEQKELFEIVDSLGYKHEEFAADIGIGMSRLASYLYGRTASVPADIMARARELKQQASPVVERWKKQFGKPMPDIIVEWEKALGLEQNANTNDEVLAGILEVNPVTVYRWRKQATTPRMHSIAKMAGRIREEVARRARRNSGAGKA